MKAVEFHEGKNEDSFLMNNNFVGSKSRWVAPLRQMTMGYNRIYFF